MAHRMMVQLFGLTLVHFILRAEGTPDTYFRTFHKPGVTHAVSCEGRGRQKVHIAGVILYTGHAMVGFCGEETIIVASDWKETGGTKCHAQVKEAVCRMCGNRQYCTNPYSIVEYSDCSEEYPVLEVVHSCEQLNDVEQCTWSCDGQSFPSTLCQPPSVIQVLDATYGEENGIIAWETNCAADWSDCVASIQEKTPSYYEDIIKACNNRSGCEKLVAEVPPTYADPCRSPVSLDGFDYVTIYYKCVLGEIVNISLPSVSVPGEEFTATPSNERTQSMEPSGTVGGTTAKSNAAVAGFLNSRVFQYGVPIAAAVLSLVAIVVIITVVVIRSKRRRSQSSSRKVESSAENIYMNTLVDSGSTATDDNGPDDNGPACNGPDDNGPECNGPDCNGPDAQNVYSDVEDKLHTPTPTPAGSKSVSGDEYAAVVKPNKKRGECADVNIQDHRNIPNASTEFGDDCMIDNQLYESQQGDVSSDPTKSGNILAYPDLSHFDPYELSLTDNQLYSVEGGGRPNE